jgi:hypothetical protein
MEMFITTSRKLTPRNIDASAVALRMGTRYFSPGEDGDSILPFQQASRFPWSSHPRPVIRCNMYVGEANAMAIKQNAQKIDATVGLVSYVHRSSLQRDVTLLKRLNNVTNRVESLEERVDTLEEDMMQVKTMLYETPLAHMALTCTNGSVSEPGFACDCNKGHFGGGAYIDRSHKMYPGCIPWQGTCPFGRLEPEQTKRTQHNQCQKDSCMAGFKYLESPGFNGPHLAADFWNYRREGSECADLADGT